MKARHSVIGLLALCIAVTGAYADGVISNLKAYEYRANGKPWRCTVTDAMTGKLKGKIYYAGDGAIEKVERFDADANKIETAYYDAKGMLKIGPDGWAAVRWWYQNSTVRLEISYDERGHPIERLFYSESGRLLGRHYRNDDRVNPNINAAMFSRLGPNNIAYYDPKESYDETTRLVKD